MEALKWALLISLLGLVALAAAAPASCHQLQSAQRKCQFSRSCDARTIERLHDQCRRDGGRV